MIKTIKKITLSSLLILGLSSLFWILLLLNPTHSYAHKTSFEFVEVYHNEALEANTGKVINDAIDIIKKSELFHKDILIQLCLNDDFLYPNIHPLIGEPLAYAILDKTVFKNCKVKFDENVVETRWAVNNNEFRRFNLTWLLAHEFTHNLQYQANTGYVAKSTLGEINWKLEGHAEYISRQFKNDGKLKEKFKKYLIEIEKPTNGLPVFELEDGTKQMQSYYKYAIVIQYMMEQNKMNFEQICDDKRNLDECYSEMLEWMNL